MRDNIRFGIFGISILSGIGLLIYAFLVWRFEIVLFGFTDYGSYFLYGIGATIIPFLLFIWGFTIGLGISSVSALILAGTFLFGVVFDKNNQYVVPSALIVNCFIALGLGLVAMFLGSEEAHEEREANSRAEWEHDNSPVVCAQCDQYLGLAKGFQSPCPRCGSNRYVVE